MAMRQREKYKPLQSIYDLMHVLEKEPKGVIQKQAKVKWQKIQFFLVEFYIKLQLYFSTTILFCCQNI